jgi:large subunit ribosomal protein L25
MRKDITVAAEPRETRGKNDARRLRAKGLAPAVLYGTGKDSVALAVSPKEMMKVLTSSSGHNTIFNLAVTQGETTPVMIVDWQFHPVKESLLHVDLKRIDPAKTMTVKVPVHLVGSAKGVKSQGGLLEVANREILIECLPDDIPAAFDFDVTELVIGSYVRAQDIALTGSMKLVSSPDLVVAHLVAPRAEAAAEATDEAKAAEPEVVKKGKKEEAPADDKKKK